MLICRQDWASALHELNYNLWNDSRVFCELCDAYLQAARWQSGWSGLRWRWHSHSCNCPLRSGEAGCLRRWATTRGTRWSNTAGDLLAPLAGAGHPWTRWHWKECRWTPGCSPAKVAHLAPEPHGWAQLHSSVPLKQAFLCRKRGKKKRKRKRSVN